MEAPSSGLKAGGLPVAADAKTIAMCSRMRDLRFLSFSRRHADKPVTMLLLERPVGVGNCSMTSDIHFRENKPFVFFHGLT
ncbi:hypothetical protein BaRGS_00010259 [Batillaria attramentaria]|uniref:Uncharacterized protein n=1 Tax=Batillaria attramentaria TaxID=370345 RepID=A0ABD0LG69_9CAEN